MNIRKKLTHLKNNNPWLKILWFKRLKQREKKVRGQDLRERIINIFNSGHSYSINLDNPVTFYDKLNWLKLNYRNPLMPIVSDKFEVRNYLEDLGYGFLLNDLLGVWDNVKDINIDSLPDRFVLKSTHGSGTSWIFLVKDKNKVNWFAQKLVMKQWLKNKIDWMGGEWHYGEMKPRIIAEKFLDGDNGELTDYKIHCFNGEISHILVCTGRAQGNLKYFYFDKDWNFLRINKFGLEAPDGFTLPKPQNIGQMIEIAKELSKPFPVVRIDFYEDKGKIYFGEFTFFESSGFDDDYTYEAQKQLGAKITLPEKNV